MISLIVLAVFMTLAYYIVGFIVFVIMMKLIYLLLIGIPAAAVLFAVGIILCCTVIFIPLGRRSIELAGKVICPF